MIRLLFILLFLFTCTDSTNPVETQEDNLTTMSSRAPDIINPGDLPWPMIVGGTEVDPACPNCKYPFMVSIQSTGYWGGHFCGGSLVRPDWVITAAHCVQGESASQLRVKIGLHNVNGTTGSETKLVDQIIVHPNYSGNSLDNDYALLHLTTESDFEPIQLITENAHDNEPVMSTTMGWGATSSGGWGSTYLLEVDVPIDNSCGNYSNWEITNNMVCAGDNNGGEDSCQGDSGGPLIMTNGDGEYELIGIVSWGYGCADAGYPGVYSRIWTRKDWFFDYIGEPQEDFIPDLYGDVNFDGSININDIVIMVNFILGGTPTDEQFITGDMNYDGIINIVDVILVVNEVLGTTFSQSVQWLKLNFPELEVENRLRKMEIK
jgi:trypsin